MNPYLQKYKQNSVTTASPKSIIVQLHDKAIQKLDQAHDAWVINNLPEMREHITRIQDIVSHLHSSLDPTMEVSKTLSDLYRYYLVQLARLFIEPKEESFTEIKQHLTEWRETWWQASYEP